MISKQIFGLILVKSLMNACLILGGISCLSALDFNSERVANSKNDKSNMAVDKQLKQNSGGEILNFSLGEKKEELGYLSTWLPDQNDNLTEVVEGPAAMALDQEGNICFLDSVREQIQIYDKHGNHLRAVGLPTMGEDYEASYSDLIVFNDLFFVLDTQNYVVAKISRDGTGTPTFIKIPAIDKNSESLLLEHFALSHDGEIIIENRYDGTIYQIVPPVSQEESYTLKEIISNPPFQPLLSLDEKGQIVGQQFNQENPEIIDYYRWKPGDSTPQKLFSLPHDPDRFMVNTIGMVEGDPILAVFSGGEEKARLSQISRFKIDGTLVSSIKMELEELPWSMNQRYHVHENEIVLCEYRNSDKKLRIMRYTL